MVDFTVNGKPVQLSEREKEIMRAAAAEYRARTRRGPGPDQAAALLQRQAALVQQSGFFDDAWYRAQVPELPPESSAIEHYLRHGASGISPGPLFDAAWYLAVNPDVAAQGRNPLVHYLELGCSEGRLPRASVDPGSGTPEEPSAPPAQAYFSYADEQHGLRVPLLHRAPLESPAVRLVAFYLPQFHPVPENDAWWGRGFTEWANVTRARPQFVGHYQPHLPGELGFYDLRLREVQLRQVELAKLYGVGAFCYYFYWFQGKRLLELPLLRHLEDPGLDFPFCICWANENWTKRWDGLEQDVLISQSYGPDDDLAFISYVSRFLRDPRYLRVEGKPLLAVYRPGLFPEPAKTAERWRKWCRDNGVGEIHLGMTRSFDRFDPEDIGFDSAIEFPPNDANVPRLGELKRLNPRFKGAVYDWRALPQRSREYVDPGYPIHRSVCPSWDNEARRSGRGSILHGSSPGAYGQWLMDAASETMSRVPAGQDRLVFVNAWNEWAEGAHLEPDRRYGYAYLEATRMALVRAELQAGSPRSGADPRIAVIVHAFYPEILPILLPGLGKISEQQKLFVTTTPELAGEVRTYLNDVRCPFELIECPNRGRDVAPFLAALRRAEAEGFEYVSTLR